MGMILNFSGERIWVVGSLWDVKEGVRRLLQEVLTYKKAIVESIQKPHAQFFVRLEIAPET